MMAMRSKLLLLLPWLVLAVSLGLTWFLWSHERQAVREHLQNQFDFSLRELTGRIDQRIAIYEQMLRGVRGLFPYTGMPDRDVLSTYISSLQLDANFTGVLSIGIVEFVPEVRKDAHVDAMHRHGFSDYAILPEGKRDIYAPVIQREPRVGPNIAPLGNDAWFNPERRSAMERARDSGLATMSSKVRLFVDLDNDYQPSVIMYLPFFTNAQAYDSIQQRRACIKGWIYASLIIKDFMGSVSVELPNGLSFSIYDGTKISETNLLYQFQKELDREPQASITSTEYLDVAGHSWTIVARTLKEFDARFDNGKATLIFGIGSAVSFLLAVSVWLIASKTSTERHRDMLIHLNQELELYKVVFDSTTEAVGVTDINGNFVYTNSSKDSLHQIHHDDMLKLRAVDLVPDDSTQIVKQIENDTSKGLCWRGKVPMKRADGTTFISFCNISSVNSADGNILYQINIHHDFTIEQERQDELDRARNLAESAARSKSEFLANMSHEIRTPMNAILGLTQHLSRTDLTVDQRDCIDKVLTSGKSLLLILNDILDLSKVEAGRVNLERIAFTLDDVITNLRSVISFGIQDKNIEVSINISQDIPICLVGDSLRLQQVLINIVGNAIKFTNSGKVAIQISAREILQTDALLLFEIIDTGIGISREGLIGLFSPFYQAETSSTRRFGGTGLGLAICRRLVELMGGEIGVESVEGQGSTFWFTARFGISDPSFLSPARLGESTGGTLLPKLTLPACLEGLSILVVEDNSINQDVVRRILEMEGASIVMADNGATALTLMREQAACFNLILMDVQMPIMDGYHATRLVRCDLGLTDIPIIALSAGVMTEERDKAIAAGMNDFVAKPFDAELLISTVAHYCGRQAVKATEVHLDPTDPFPVFDLVGSLRRAGGNRALLASLLGRFIEQFASVADAIQLLLDSGEIEEAIRHVHTLRGSAGNVGASRLADLAAKLETSLRAQSRTIESMDQALLSRLIDDTLVAIREAMTVLEPEANGRRHPAFGDDINLSLLKSLLEANDIAAIDTFAAMRDNLVSRGGAQAVSQIAKAIERLDFPVALEYLTKEFGNDR